MSALFTHSRGAKNKHLFVKIEVTKRLISWSLTDELDHIDDHQVSLIVIYNAIFNGDTLLN